MARETGFPTINDQRMYSNDRLVQGINVKTRRLIANINGTLDKDDYLIAYNPLSATRTFTLLTAASCKDRHYVIKDEAGTGAAGVKVTFVGTVDGAVNPDAIATAYGVKRFYSNGVGWFSE